MFGFNRWKSFIYYDAAIRVSRIVKCDFQSQTIAEVWGGSQKPRAGCSDLDNECKFGSRKHSEKFKQLSSPFRAALGPSMNSMELETFERQETINAIFWSQRNVFAQYEVTSLKCIACEK